MSEHYKTVDPASIDFTHARLAQKTAWVAARPAREEERITTVLRGAKAETTNTARAGDMVVTNPGGERYIIEARKFFELYRAAGVAGMFEPRSLPVYVVTVSENVEFQAPWNRKMRIRAGGVLVRDENGAVHGIQADEFASTYSYLDEAGT